MSFYICKKYIISMQNKRGISKKGQKVNNDEIQQQMTKVEKDVGAEEDYD